jgi:glycosyltransferase involved in cell wall biosynthesis
MNIVANELMPPIAPREGWPWEVPALPALEEDVGLTKLPTFSVITPSYNQGHLIEATLRSIHGQRYPRLEHILQEAGSQDATEDVLAHYCGLPALKVHRERDRGQSDGLNRGFRKATGEIIGWLNSDDLYAPGTLLRVGRYFAEHPEAMVLFGDCEVIDLEGRITEFYRGKPVTLEGLIRNRVLVPQPATFFRRQVFDEFGYLDESLHYAMDYDFWIRLGSKYTFHYLPEVLAQFRVHSASKTGTDFLDTFLPEIRKIMRRYGTRGVPPWILLQRWADQGRYASWWYWEGVWEAHRSGNRDRVRRYARSAGLAWLPGLVRYHRLVEFARSWLPQRG